MIKSPPAKAEEEGLIPGSGGSPGGGNDNHSSILAWRITLDRGIWRAPVHRAAETEPRCTQVLLSGGADV